ncbi:hypothetical protein [Pseudanabaena mucicola]|uniref:DUF2281 domain-containing protein n=1 Tax=Pseudanabaena mucicola FACHB-723 TaxID=2692860 RepID=A0ABR8A2Q1_9CYAN|nr:hypothetical protein [Pseudanabaena mucicola]MBD2189826.1 hypothetical protein [Pseudanabaena mucicola FACHB-723]
MTELLERVIEQLKILPAEEQDAIATRFLAEMEDERAWKIRFASTMDDQWDNLAAMARQEITSRDLN